MIHVQPAPKQDFSNHRLSVVEHNVHEHPLMTVDALRNLAHFLKPRGQCRFVDPAITIDAPFRHDGESTSSIDEVFDAINEPGSWLALYNVEVHPEYGQLLNAIIDSVEPLIRQQGSPFNVGGFIFLSAAPSVTPFHIDRENNFWLQIAGRKLMTVFDWTDDRVVRHSDVEDFIVNRTLDNVRLTDRNRSLGTEVLNRPGQGLYFPATSPHMTRCPQEWQGEGVSISMGVVFYTDQTRRMARIYQCNQFLRRFGLVPSRRLDANVANAFKAPTGRLLGGLKRRLRGYRPPPGSY